MWEVLWARLTLGTEVGVGWIDRRLLGRPRTFPLCDPMAGGGEPGPKAGCWEPKTVDGADRLSRPRGLRTSPGTAVLFQLPSGTVSPGTQCPLLPDSCKVSRDSSARDWRLNSLLALPDKDLNARETHFWEVFPFFPFSSSIFIVQLHLVQRFVPEK